MARTGRPKKEINADEFEKLCGMQCTLAEVASFFDCSEDTIERWCRSQYEMTFADVYKKKSAKGKASLRRAQIQAALAGNPTMLIWLGKQYLDQREPKQEIALSTEEDSSIAEMEKYFNERKQEGNP